MKQRTKPCGLKNIGNTCFFNSTIQCLFHLPIWNTIYKSLKSRIQEIDINTMKIPKNETKETVAHMLSFAIQLCDVYDGYCCPDSIGIVPRKCLLSLHRLAKAKGSTELCDFFQYDAHEFFIFMMDSLQLVLETSVRMVIEGTPDTDNDSIILASLRTWKDAFENAYSPIVHYMHGQHACIMKTKDGKKEYNYDPYMFIHLPLPWNKASCSIYDCFQEYCVRETIDDHETILSKQNRFMRFPPFLCVVLRRFHMTGRKINTNVSFPLTSLNLTQFVEVPTRIYEYDCVGVVNHTGTLQGGHYYSFVKQNNKWWNVNDMRVTPIDDESYLVGPHAYILFYQLR